MSRKNESFRAPIDMLHSRRDQRPEKVIIQLPKDFRRILDDTCTGVERRTAEASTKTKNEVVLETALEVGRGS